MIHCIEARIGHLAVSGDRRSMSGVNPHRVHSSPHFCPAEAAKRRIEDSNTSFVAENRNRSMSMILERNYLEVKKIIVENRDLLEKLVTELMNKRTLISSDVQKVFSKDNRKTA